MGKNARLKRERRAQRAEERSTSSPSGDQQVAEPSPAAVAGSSRLQSYLTSPLLHSILIILLCVATGIFPIESEDIFSNIVTGRLLWTERSIPTTDPFSFTGPHNWFLNRPLPSLIFFAVHSLGGLPAIQIFCALLFGCTYAIVYYVWARRTSMPLLVFSVTTLAILASCYWFQTRIYVFAYLFTAIALLLVTSERRRIMVWTIPLQVLWINSHPSAILGTFLVGFWWLVTTLQARRFDRFSSSVFFGVLVSNVLCPVGFRSYLKFADEIFGSHPSRANIYEWFSPFHPYVSSQHLAWWFYGSIGLFITVLGVLFSYSGKVRSAIPLVPITLILFVLSLLSARHIPLFYIGFIGVLVCTIEYLWNRSAPSSRKRYGEFRTIAGGMLMGILLVVMSKVIFLGYSNGEVERRFALGIDTRKFPERPTQMLLDAHVGGNIFSDYGSGSYFLYRMYPRYKVYIDSARLDEVYGEEGYRRYMLLGNNMQVAKEEIAKHDIRSFILPLPASVDDIVNIYRFLSSEREWRLAFFDDGHMVFITASEAHARNIPTYRVLSPFMETEKLLKENPGAAAQLTLDFDLGDRINPDSIAYLTLKAFFLKFQSRTADLQATLNHLAGVCERTDPSSSCRQRAAKQLVRFGRYR